MNTFEKVFTAYLMNTVLTPIKGPTVKMTLLLLLNYTILIPSKVKGYSCYGSTIK